eukprot:Polyplicarium_translucidae@DN4017_c0_g1_i1.p1
MTELNGSPPRPIRVNGKYSFTIEDTSGYTAYEAQGIAVQVKVPTRQSYISYKEACDAPVPPTSKSNACVSQWLANRSASLPCPDFGKIGRSEQLHFATQAMLRYEEKHGSLPPMRDAAAEAECIEIARGLLAEAEERKQAGAGGVVAFDSLDVDVCRKTARFGRAQLSPVAAFVGGVAAQEAMKATGKFTPLRQWLYFDSFETMLPKELEGEIPADTAPRGDRYDDYRAVWGEAVLARLWSAKVFLVGAGALGCELLKSFAMMGIACGPEGLITVTDMDNIEVSHLNRQFLYRRRGVGVSKSRGAADAAMVVNRSHRAKAMCDRVVEETALIFVDPFWESLDFVVNALDNVPSRLYVDGRCTDHGIPFFESGTHGTRASTEVCVPFLTQAYSDTPRRQRESVPFCTL